MNIEQRNRRLKFIEKRLERAQEMSNDNLIARILKRKEVFENMVFDDNGEEIISGETTTPTEE